MPAGLDAESAEWLRALAEAGPRREAALARLHAMLVRIAHGEAARRGPRLRIAGPELDDLAYQAAADALVLPVEAHMIAFAPSSIALATATTMPRSLNEPVGLHDSSLK